MAETSFDAVAGSVNSNIQTFNGYTLKEFLIPNSSSGSFDVGSTDCFLDGRSYHIQSGTASTKLPLNFYNGDNANWAYINSSTFIYGLAFGSSMIHAFIWVKEPT